MAAANRATALTLAVCVLAVTGCDRIKAMTGGGADGGTATTGAGGSGGGFLSFLGGDFEGGITMVITEKTKRKDAPGQITFDIKKPKYRLDFTALEANPQLAGGGSMIIDPPAKKGYLLIPAQKMAMVIDFEKMKNLPKGTTPLGGPPHPSGPSGPPPTPPKIEKTGKKDTVAGYTCDIWNVTSDKDKAELCLAEGITWFNVSDLGWTNPTLTAAAAISDMNHFPLRVITYDPKGAEDTRMEATKIEKKKLDDTLFVVPPDYKIMDLSAMMGGMMGGAPPGGPPGMPSGFPTAPPRRTH